MDILCPFIPLPVLKDAKEAAVYVDTEWQREVDVCMVLRAISGLGSFTLVTLVMENIVRPRAPQLCSVIDTQLLCPKVPAIEHALYWRVQVLSDMKFAAEALVTALSSMHSAPLDLVDVVAMYDAWRASVDIIQTTWARAFQEKFDTYAAASAHTSQDAYMAHFVASAKWLEKCADACEHHLFLSDCLHRVGEGAEVYAHLLHVAFKAGLLATLTAPEYQRFVHTIPPLRTTRPLRQGNDPAARLVAGDEVSVLPSGTMGIFGGMHPAVPWIRAGQVCVLRALRDAGVNMNVVLPGGVSLLTLAVGLGQEEVAMWLLSSAVVDPRLCGSSGITALHVARSPRMVVELAKYGARPEQLTLVDRLCPFITAACSQKQADIASAFLEQFGVGVDASPTISVLWVLTLADNKMVRCKCEMAGMTYRDHEEVMRRRPLTDPGLPDLMAQPTLKYIGATATTNAVASTIGMISFWVGTYKMQLAHHSAPEKEGEE